MLLLVTDTYTLGFPGTAAETQYLQERLQHGYDLVAVLAAGLTFIYYWKTYNAATTHGLVDGDRFSPRTDS